MRRERGHIAKRGNSYAVVIDEGKDPTTGKRKQRWISVEGGSRAAEKKLTEVLHELDRGIFMAPVKITLAEYMTQWLEHMKPKLSIRSFERYSDIAKRYLLPELGNYTLNQIRPDQLQGLYDLWLNKGLSNATVRYHHAVIHNALEAAVKQGIIGRNVCDALEVPRKRHQEMHIWNKDEIERFLESTKDSPYHDIFYLMLFTGMRRSEVLALRWCDVDVELGQVHIERALQQLRDSSLKITQPKSQKSRRTITLPPSAALVLSKHREVIELERKMAGRTWNDMDLVFTRGNGKPIRPNTLTYAWVSLVKQSGLKPIRLHDARHTHASLMLKQGIHPKIVQERLGHSSISMTLDTYSHVVPGLQDAAAKKFDELFQDAPAKDVSKL